ncbi:hypothetical protein JST97_18600 [bacterium]|nr:hypothetical protein [bacterium]
MSLSRVAHTPTGGPRLTRALQKLHTASLGEQTGLSQVDVSKQLAFCQKALDDIASLRRGGERARLLELMPGTADFALIESATDVLPTDSTDLVQLRNDFRDAYVQARRSATRAERGKPAEGVFPLQGGVLVEGPQRLLIQQGTRVFQGLEGTRGETFWIENGQPMREAAALTAAGPMSARFLDRGPINYAVLSLLSLESLLLDSPIDPVPAGDVVHGINGGKPWGPRSVLKWDEFPGRQQYKGGGLELTDQADAPNYRKLPNHPVHGVAQPSRVGLKAIFKKMVETHHSKDVFWMNTRAEAVLYIDGKPYNVRELSSRLNLPYCEGASGEELERLEMQLKQMLIERGSVPVESEVSGSVQEIPIHSGNIRTTREEMLAAAKEAGVVLDYHRIPIRDESAPSPQELDLMRREVERFRVQHPKDHPQYVVNCHMGRGRTTTGMIAIAMTLDALNCRPISAQPGESRTRDLEMQASQVVDISLAIVENDLELKDYRAHLVQAESQRPTDPSRLLQLKAAIAERQRRAHEYRERQLRLEMYSLYLATTRGVSFSQWLGLPEQQSALSARRQTLEEQVREIETRHASQPQAQASKLLELLKQRTLALAA